MFGMITSVLLDKLEAICFAQPDGVTESNTPDTINVGTTDTTGFKKPAPTIPFVQFLQARCCCSIR